MTPISFALEILLDCETIEKAHKACRKYIKLLESDATAQFTPAPRDIYGKPIATQAPSTQRLMEQHSAAPAIAAPARIVGGEVQTGDGTRGPRKF